MQKPFLSQKDDVYSSYGYAKADNNYSLKQ